MEPDLGQLKIYGPLGLFCLFLVGVVYIMWKRLGEKDTEITSCATAQRESDQAYQAQVVALIKGQRDEVGQIVRDHRDEMVKLTQDHKEELAAMVDRVIETNKEHARELRAALDRQLTLSESIERKMSVVR
jgi:hypothetical protein